MSAVAQVAPGVERQPGAPGWTAALKDVWRRRQTKAGVVLVLAVVVVAVIGPVIAPHDPGGFAGIPYSGPSSDALLGTDYLGRDVLSRVLHGGLIVLWTSVTAAVIGVGTGVLLGLVAGYRGAWRDATIMRGMDVVLAFPQLVLVLLFVSFAGPKLWLIALLTGVALAPGVVRVVRGITMEVAERDFVRAAELQGLSRRKIMLSEILPNLSSPILVEFATRLIWAVALIAGLSFLGLGVQPPAADWGLMINENRNGLSVQPLAVAAPVAMLALFTAGAGLIAEGLTRTMAGIDREGEAA
jgi:peptide/nickel transport system permease protein